TLYQLGSLYSRERRLDEAIAAFRRSIEMGPGNVSAYYGLGKALLQAGQVEQGRELLERSQEMKQQGLTTSVGTRYGEQGKYSYAVEDDRVRLLARSAAPPPIEVRYVAVKPDRSGLGAAGGKKASCGPGPGLAAADLDADGDVDVFLPACDGGRFFRNDGGLRFTDVTAERAPEGGLPPASAGVFGDPDKDGVLELFLTGPSGGRLLAPGPDGRLVDRTEEAGLRSPGAASGAAWADVDHDGDLDLYVVRRDGGEGRTPNLLFRNRGDGTFFEDAGPSGLTGAAGAAPSLLFSDADNDRDIDLILPGLDGPWQLMRNDRVGTFTDVAAERGLAAGPARGVAAGDFDKDGFMDLAAAGPEGLRLLRNLSGGSFLQVELPASAAGMSASGVAFLDFDNDGFLDLAAAIDAATGPAIRLLRNAGEGRFEDRTDAAGLDRVVAAPARSLLAEDLDGDGDLDLLVSRAGRAAPLLLRNDGGSRNHSLEVEAVGRGSNRGGIGTKVELKSGRLWQKMEVVSTSGFMTGTSGRVHFGLGDRERADTLRFLWPSGVLQDEIDPETDRLAQVQELDRKGSSCPILYAWNGHAFGFVTDFLGGSAIGYRLGAETFNTPDTDEYVKLEADQLVTREGRLELRMVNQLEEVIFFDGVSLLAVDHPSDRRIYPNERLLPAPPFPGFEIFPVEEERAPVAAVEDGVDVLDRILERDRRWPDGFALLPFKGYAAEHALEVDPGELPTGRRIVLLADAWIDYADSTSNLAASQAGLHLQPPRLDVVGEDGRWETKLPQLGFPAGLPKTLAVELTGVLPASGDRRFRIVTNMRIYFDRIRVGIVDEAAEVRLSRLAPAASELRFRGYPRPVSPDGNPPFGYDYDDARERAGWKDFGGAFTAYGDVRGLLEAPDDRYVIARHGDEVALSFEAGALPPLPPGWSRTWLLYADGFGKDMDLNSAAPDRIEPLPFHAMESYPPPAAEQNRRDAERLDWLLRHNTRRAGASGEAGGGR
ncbi:MAG: FG-GAP-like repeat-containing protein, partial [Acidobacteriota bacterium]